MAISLARWQPPYSAAEIGLFASPEGVEVGAGEVVLLQVSDCEDTLGTVADAASLAGVVRSLRRRFPGSPVAIWIPQAAPEHVIDLARAATALHVRAILGGPAPNPARLRFELSHSQGLSAFVLRWASDAGYIPEGTAATEVGALLDAAPNVRTLQRLARERQEATRTWRSHFRQLRLPPPRAWLGLAHMLHQALHLQRNREQPLQKIAECLGYSDVTLMHHRFRHVFRMSPGAVRSLLGAEPLLHHWFQGATRQIRR
ncbi:helix-turn-helix domain-containing protein [Longimicrobium sp.]|uniref:helix-turn-helix domain-containing protein n=1 Tax=Longimicrobium sp. TaxID=2029185 RepID=UPI0039C9BDD1